MSSESQPVNITLFNKPHTESVVCALQISIVPRMLQLIHILL